MRRDRTHYYVYPEYLDKSLTRKEGRRLPRNQAVDKPTLLEIKLAAEKMGYSVESPQEESAYSRRWWEQNGLIMVEKKESKLTTLRKLSTEITTLIRPALEKRKKELAKKPKTRKEDKPPQRPRKVDQTPKRPQRRRR